MKRAGEHLRAVSEAAKAFAEATTDYERLLDTVARILSERVRDACAVFLSGAEGEPLRTKTKKFRTHREAEEWIRAELAKLMKDGYKIREAKAPAP